jgi:hypothetical protein
MSKITKTVAYRLIIAGYGCYDDGGLGHDMWSHNYPEIIKDATSDRDAKLKALDRAKELSNQKKQCHCHPGPPSAVRIEKTVHEVTDDGFERTTTGVVPWPEAKKCPCGKVYRPIRGESACHELVAAQ